MCLNIVYGGIVKKQALAQLPDEFPVWKVVKNDGRPACASNLSNEPTLTKPGKYRACYQPRGRAPMAKAEVGFHAMLGPLSDPVLKYMRKHHADRKVHQFWAEKAWVKTIGKYVHRESSLDALGVVLSYIESREDDAA